MKIGYRQKNFGNFSTISQPPDKNLKIWHFGIDIRCLYAKFQPSSFKTEGEDRR